jgi:hypothetical protein
VLLFGIGRRFGYTLGPGGATWRSRTPSIAVHGAPMVDPVVVGYLG